MSRATTGGKPKSVAALAQGLAVLSCFSTRNRCLTLRELAATSGLPLAAVEHLAQLMAQLGFLDAHEQPGVYSLGPGALTFGGLALKHFDLRELAAPLMQELADQTGASVALGSRRDWHMVCIEVHNSSTLVSFNMEVGMQLPLAHSAIGRAYLARSPEQERSALLDRARASVEQHCALSETIERSLASYETLGACSSFGEWHPEINGVAVGLRTSNGLPLLSLACGAPALNASPQYMLEEVRPRLLEAARRLEQEIGHAVA